MSYCYCYCNKTPNTQKIYFSIEKNIAKVVDTCNTYWNVNNMSLVMALLQVLFIFFFFLTLKAMTFYLQLLRLWANPHFNWTRLENNLKLKMICSVKELFPGKWLKLLGSLLERENMIIWLIHLHTNFLILFKVWLYIWQLKTNHLCYVFSFSFISTTQEFYLYTLFVQL